MRKDNINTMTYKKQIPELISEPIIHALEFYPELQRTPLEFRFAKPKEQMIMNAQPDILSMLRLMEERKYYVNINRTIKLGDRAHAIEELPESVLIGWIGHELGHIMDYEERSAWGMVKFGFNYVLSPTFVKGAERRADEFAVRHGMSDYIMETKNFILNHAEVSERYKAKIKRLYLSPEEIMNLVATKAGDKPSPAF